MTKKILSVFLSLLMLCSVFAVAVNAAVSEDEQAFLDYKATIITQLETTLEPDEYTSLVADLNELQFDAEKTLDENKAAIDEIAFATQETEADITINASETEALVALISLFITVFAMIMAFFVG